MLYLDFVLFIFVIIKSFLMNHLIFCIIILNDLIMWVWSMGVAIQSVLLSSRQQRRASFSKVGKRYLQKMQ